MLFVSSVIMALAWIGHIRFRHKGYVLALIASWCLVLPEYILNVSAIRYGHEVFSG
ncbi:MAG: DMT family protein, partial [Deltaproteobacteria bacterium]|nr:DMT family protein [Deltaproteobacteria bacterium]